MIEFSINNVSFRVEKVEDLRRLIEEKLLDRVMHSFFLAYADSCKCDDIFREEEHMGFDVGEEEDDEETDIFNDFSDFFGEEWESDEEEEEDDKS